MLDKRFPTALQIMQGLVLAELHGLGLYSSAEIASRLQANPTFVRRLLKTLARYGLLVSHMGRNGGFELAKPAETITLGQIYRAAIEDKKLWTPRTGLPRQCVVSSNFEAYFDNLVGEADNAILDVLDRKNLAESFDAIIELDMRQHAQHAAHCEYLAQLRSGNLRDGHVAYEPYALVPG